MVIDVYGISNCTTVRKARAWLDGHGLAHRLIDFKRTPPEADALAQWCRAFGWEQVLNRRGTTWRTLEPAEQAAVRDEASAIVAMRAHPSLVRRPVVRAGGRWLIGFDPDAYARALPGTAGASVAAAPGKPR